MPIICMLHLRLQTGGTGENAAELTFTCVHVKVALPTSSKPVLQLEVAVSSTEFPVKVIIPFIGSTGSGHSATQKKSFSI